MKANRFVLGNDDAVSPVIAVILMVAITVVLAATVYLWVSGFGTNQQSLVQASFGAKAVDLPWANTDTDTSDDAIIITYVSGMEDLVNDDVTISFDGIVLNWSSTASGFTDGAWTVGDYCTTSPGGDADNNWERGASLFFIDTTGSGTWVQSGCSGAPSAVGNLGNLKGVHQLTISVKGQVVLDTSIEVHDSATA